MQCTGVYSCSSLLQPLGDVSQGHGEGLEGGEGVLEVQRVGRRVDPPELHHLEQEKTLSKDQASFSFSCKVITTELLFTENSGGAWPQLGLLETFGTQTRKFP